MRFLVRNRGEGKTTALLEWARNAPEGEHRVIVTHDRRSAMMLLRDVRSQAEREGRPCEFESWQFVSFDEIKHGAFSGVLRGRGGQIVLGVDNVDIILGGLAGWPVAFVTATGER